MKVDRFFDARDRARVAEAVKAAESRTSGQIVPVVVERSGAYGALAWALADSFLVAVIVLGLWLALQSVGILPPVSFTLADLFCGAALLAAAQLALASIPPVSRLLVRAQFDAAVRQRALSAFVEHGVHRTREENGVLLFASLYERRVVVLGDRAVHEKLGDSHWKRAVETLIAGIRAGDPAEGFCRAIADIGEEMARVFPRGAAPQPNEISDELRLDR